MVEGINVRYKKNVLVNIKNLEEKSITIEKLSNVRLISEFEKFLLTHNVEEELTPLHWFRTEIMKRLNKNG